MTASLKSILKWTALALASVLAIPFLLSYWLRSRLFDRDRALMSSSQTLALVPGVSGQYLRRAFYMRVLDRFHRSATVEFGTIFSKAGARVGANVYIGPMCHLGLAELGDDVLLAAGVHVPSGPLTHGIGDPEARIRDQPGELRRVRIGEGSWVGAGAVVLADIGEESVVGAGAVVTKPLPARVFAGGVPAQVLRARGEPRFEKQGDAGSRSS